MRRHAELAWTFLRIGALAFGGLGATLALIEHDLVRRRNVMSAAMLEDAVTYTKLLPGSTVVQIVAYLGWRLGGWTGSAIATIAFVLPSVAAMLILADGYSRVAAVAAFDPARRGVLAAVIGLLLVAIYRLAAPVVVGRVSVVLALGAFVVAAAVDLHALVIVFAAGVVGLLHRRAVR